ncbi:MAG: cryptochrome/photolyase family protein, partial [Pseudomonadota bacterium]
MTGRSENPILVPILGDQLTRTLSSLRGQSKDDTIILMMEVWDEATYVKHHKQKIALIFSAMRHFAEELREVGWVVDYIKLTDDDNSGSFTGEVARAIERHDPRGIRVTEASEWRVQQSIEEWPDKFACEVEIVPDDRFLCSHSEFQEWAEGRKHLTMEHFYREMRRKTGLLMTEDGKPRGGAWNYDKDNRKAPDEEMDPPPVPKFECDDITREVVSLVQEKFADHFGSLESFEWPVTSDDAEKAADAFFAQRIEKFGPYQDAMVHGSDDLYHSMLSTSINCGLLDPLKLCQRAEQAYQDGKAPLNSVEGFIRQIIGWRE